MKKLILFATFAVLGAASAAVHSIGDPGPFGNSVFVRGGFNDWGAMDEMTWDAVNQQYNAVLTIDAGDWEFKIADEVWSNPDFGPIGDPNVTLGMPTDIGVALGANFSLSLIAAEQYLFVLSNLALDLSSGQLTVSIVPLPAAFLLFASGLAGLGFLRRRR